MVIVAISGNSAIDTENIECFGFQVKFDKNNRPIVRNGAVLVDKKKINISFKSGNSISLTAINETDGQIIFDNILINLRFC